MLLFQAFPHSHSVVTALELGDLAHLAGLLRVVWVDATDDVRNSHAPVELRWRPVVNLE
eukprot:CAMPEP_0119419980 /NCGR_PEP_ID=MMETSP1335-20130426/22295_1 /TAXON_ID=259385 /ORGANISM="Chrysoculter rhomboideus, Strain RCC1486" /LENGTH=58 /DNA_ID=CAMNT_0007445313 /DNA_START=187 /DNA_END=360 /DNA_ORIENTATION=-